MNIKYFFKKAAFCLLLFLSIKNTAQSTASQIDSLRNKAHNTWLKKGDFNRLLLVERNLLKESKKQDYIRGEIKGYINIANALAGLNRNKESLQFLDMAKKKLRYHKDAGIEAQMNHVYGVNYYSLGLYKRALEEFNKALDAAKRITDVRERQSRQYSAYDWKRSCFRFLGLMDSVYSNERKCMKSPMPMLFITIADRHFKNKNIDSAEYYINKANRLLLTKKIPLEGKANVLRAYGRLCIEKKDYNKSLRYLLESLEITRKSGLRKRTLETYKLLATAYKCLYNMQKENEYLLKYSQLNDSIRENERIALNSSVEDILAGQDTNYTSDSKNLYYVLAGIILISAAIFVILIKIYKVRQKIQDQAMNEKKLESDMLRRKLDGVYEEVVNLAIKSDPSFIHKFREAYSEFYNNLTKENPGLTAGDILFCAFIKLNFSNKEIAEYAHISIRTVESKKYRLKKKLGISAEMDLNKWIAQY